MKIVIKADIGVIDSLNAGDVFKEIAKKMTNLAEQCFAIGEMGGIPKSGTIENPEGEPVGSWEIRK